MPVEDETPPTPVDPMSWQGIGQAVVITLSIIAMMVLGIVLIASQLPANP